MRINQILLDMDGVLCDFHTAALKTHGREDLAEDWPEGEWGIHKVLGISQNEFWSNIAEDPNFWQNLKPYGWAEKLLFVLSSFGKGLTFATSPARDYRCPSEKVDWLRRFLTRCNTPPARFEELSMSFMIGKKKWLMARPGTVLIDDNDLNCQSFREHGGYSILFPQPWNKRHWMSDCNRVEYVTQRLLSIMERAPVKRLPRLFLTGGGRTSSRPWKSATATGDFTGPSGERSSVSTTGRPTTDSTFTAR